MTCDITLRMLAYLLLSKVATCTSINLLSSINILIFIDWSLSKIHSGYLTFELLAQSLNLRGCLDIADPSSGPTLGSLTCTVTCDQIRVSLNRIFDQGSLYT